ncbi:MAG: glycerophosphodiester phosphodiesterase family protein, partial [Alphaproteobacteria bacterium]
VGVTSDGVVVVAHNRRLAEDMARGPDGKWIDDPAPLISQLSYDQLATYDVGRAKPGSTTARRFPEQQAVDGTRVPKLAQVLALGAKPGNAALKFNIETKISPLAPADTLAPEAFVAALLGVVRASGMETRVSIQSFDWRTLMAAKRLAPAIPTVCLTAQQRWLDTLQTGSPGPSPWLGGIDADDHAGSPAAAVKAAGCAVWSPFAGDLTPQSLAQAHDLGLQVVVWTVNKPGDMTRLKSLGVDGLITDYPDRAIKLFGR